MEKSIKIDKNFSNKIGGSIKKPHPMGANLRLVPRDDDPSAQLMLQFQQGDEDAFTSLFKQYYPMIFKFSYRVLMNSHDAEDITQETFLQVYKAAPRYKPMAKFTTWLYIIAKNLCINRFKSEKPIPLMKPPPNEAHLSPEELLASSEPLPPDKFEQKQMLEAVIRAIRSLSPSLRIPIILSRYEGLSSKEISGIMACSEALVRLRLHRAVEALSKQLNGNKKG